MYQVSSVFLKKKKPTNKTQNYTDKQTNKIKNR